MTPFPHGDFDEEIYMEQLKGFLYVVFILIISTFYA